MDIVNPFGFVAGRWAFATADTAGDPDRAPDYIPASGASITFTPETPRQVVPDSPGWTGVINKRVVGKLNEEGRLVDAEGHNHFALGVGTYAVHYYFGNGIKWPSHRIQVTEAHTASNPLWLPPMPAPPDVPGAVNRTIQVPADGTDGQVLVWDGAGFSWADPPTGPRGPKGDLDAEQLAGAPRLTNMAHNAPWTSRDATIDSQTDTTATFTATALNGELRRGAMSAGNVYYVSVEVKATSDRVFGGMWEAPVYHSGSGDWERLTGLASATGVRFFIVRDNRTSGWDPIEVRDPVMINLTAVFGAGREPTREYMDALLAKHGNYIGGVDQFAFGDALQTLTVAGPGMTLRHDTSVGTRVFLDHPSGTTMLHGDTGWRDISSLLHEEWVLAAAGGVFQIIRQNNTVTLAARLQRAPDSPTRWPGEAIPLLNTTDSSLPNGFDPLRIYSTYATLQVLTKYIGELVGNTWGDELRVRARSVPNNISWKAGDVLGFQVSWRTSQAWATSLPGLPV